MDWSIYNPQQKFWLPADLSMDGASGLFGTAVDSPKLSMVGFKRWSIYATTVVVGGNRTAGSWKLTADLFDPSGNLLFAAPIDVLTGINRFTGTVRSFILFGDGGAPIVLTGTGAGTAGTLLGLIRAPVSAIQLHAVADAVFSGGTTDPTSVALTVQMVGQS